MALMKRIKLNTEYFDKTKRSGRLCAPPTAKATRIGDWPSASGLLTFRTLEKEKTQKKQTGKSITSETPIARRNLAPHARLHTTDFEAGSAPNTKSTRCKTGTRKLLPLTLRNLCEE